MIPWLGTVRDSTQCTVWKVLPHTTRAILERLIDITNISILMSLVKFIRKILLVFQTVHVLLEEQNINITNHSVTIFKKS